MVKVHKDDEEEEAAGPDFRTLLTTCRLLAWVMAGVVAAILTGLFEAGFPNQSGAMQQAALAGAYCVRLIALYVLVRLAAFILSEAERLVKRR